MSLQISQVEIEIMTPVQRIISIMKELPIMEQVEVLQELNRLAGYDPSKNHTNSNSNRANDPNSKKMKARAVYIEGKKLNKQRKDIIAEMCAPEIGCTFQGAGTYYQNFSDPKQPGWYVNPSEYSK